MFDDECYGTLNHAALIHYPIPILENLLGSFVAVLFLLQLVRWQCWSVLHARLYVSRTLGRWCLLAGRVLTRKAHAWEGGKNSSITAPEKRLMM
jgi:uncharacterized protein involved in response to NO